MVYQISSGGRWRAMSASGQKQTLGSALGMSALPPKADFIGTPVDFR